MKSTVFVVLGALWRYLNIDHIQAMLIEAKKAVGYKPTHFRVIPEPDRSPLQLWAKARGGEIADLNPSDMTEEQKQEAERVTIWKDAKGDKLLTTYWAKDHGGPIPRNNLTVRGKDIRSGAKCEKHGPAKVLVMLGPVPAHYPRTNSETGKTTMQASTHEAMLEFWLRVKTEERPVIVQVMELKTKDAHAEPEFKVLKPRNGKFYHLDRTEDGDEVMNLRKPAPAPKAVSSTATSRLSQTMADELTR